MTVNLHAWTHRPKAQGGTDPIAVAAGPISAIAMAGQRSQSMSGNLLNLYWDIISTNDPSFGYSDVVSSRARWVTISTEGMYVAQFVANWDSDFSASDFPFLRPMCLLAGTPNALLSTTSTFSADAGAINTEQFTTAEMDHHAVSMTIWFEFDAADWGEATPGIGLQIGRASCRERVSSPV